MSDQSPYPPTPDPAEGSDKPPPPTQGAQIPGGFSPAPPPPIYGAAPAGGAPVGQLAEWAQRVLGWLVDIVPIVAIWIVGWIVAIIIGQVSGILAGLFLVLVYLVVLGYWILQLVKQGNTGQTIGKKIIGLKVVAEATGQPIGPGLSIVRAIAHFVDGIILDIGFLFPLWDPKKQTLADKIMSTVVVKVPPQKFSITPPA